MSEERPRFPEGVNDDRPLLQAAWAVQRAAWIGFAFILLACLSGLFGGSGPFSGANAEHKGGSIDYPAISRWNAPDELRVSFPPSPGDRTLILDPRFLEIFSIEGIDPPQKAISAKDGRIGYVFAADPAHATQVILRLQGQSPGYHTFSLGIDDDVSDHSTFIFP